MKRIFFVIAAAVVFVSCKDKSSGKKFEVNGTITNNPAKMIYLEEIPMATMQRMVVDSVIIGSDGKYKLKTTTGEDRVYNIRLDQNTYPLASVINDAPAITVNATFTKENKEFTGNYEVKGSPSSEQMKDFMIAMNEKLQAIFYIDVKGDSLQKSGASDSVLIPMQKERMSLSMEARNIVSEAVSKSNNPALTMFELGYYQSMANDPAYKLQPYTLDEVNKTVGDVAAKFPMHQGVIAIKNALAAQSAKAMGNVGQQAPEISLPDVNGKEVKLSSYKGKYVLVDFWASWCMPCRRENPNVVAAYNKFKDKNFDILGVSLDKEGEKDKWLAAIKKDNLSWTQVSELKEWQSAVVDAYGFGEQGIPYNVLVDPQGKIIAERLMGQDLENKLAELLK